MIACIPGTPYLKFELCDMRIANTCNPGVQVVKEYSNSNIGSLIVWLINSSCLSGNNTHLEHFELYNYLAAIYRTLSLSCPYL